MKSMAISNESYIEIWKSKIQTDIIRKDRKGFSEHDHYNEIWKYSRRQLQKPVGIGQEMDPQADNLWLFVFEIHRGYHRPWWKDEVTILFFVLFFFYWSIVYLRCCKKKLRQKERKKRTRVMDGRKERKKRRKVLSQGGHGILSS